jgi:mono/diheme cytochrome c family protein
MFFAVLALVVVVAACGGDDGDPPPSGSGSTPDDLVAEGQGFYEETCAACHGVDLKGTDNGPPFLDAIYEPGHHPDEAFYAAVENGVQPHHWNFGPMPPQTEVSRDEVEAIVAYVRAEQRDAGIYSE